MVISVTGVTCFFSELQRKRARSLCGLRDQVLVETYFTTMKYRMIVTDFILHESPNCDFRFNVIFQ